MEEIKRKEITKIFGAGAKAQADGFLTVGAGRGPDAGFWRWGDDNLFPSAWALMSRRSQTHRRIINDKADYISGKGLSPITH